MTVRPVMTRLDRVIALSIVVMQMTRSSLVMTGQWGTFQRFRVLGGAGNARTVIAWVWRSISFDVVWTQMVRAGR
jgi:hypothetical protein